MKPTAIERRSSKRFSQTSSNSFLESSLNINSPISSVRLPTRTKTIKPQSFQLTKKSSNDSNFAETQRETSLSHKRGDKLKKSHTLSMSSDLRKMSILSSKSPSNQKTVRFKSNLDQIEEDIDRDYLLGNMGKSLVNAQRNKHHHNERDYMPSNKSNNSSFLDPPRDFIKNSFDYDSNFKKTFESYLNGETDLNSVMNIKNFPSLYVFNKRADNKITYVHPKKFENNIKSGALTDRKITSPNSNNYNNYTKGIDIKRESVNLHANSISERKIDKIPIGTTKNAKALAHFDQIKEIIKQRLLLKKKIKKEAFQLNDWNVKFFQNFYSITKEYIEKIKKKDLVTVNPNKNYYDKDYPTYQRLMKNFSILNYTKTPLTKETSAKKLEDENEVKNSKQLHKDYLKINAESFLALLKSETDMQKEKKKITVPHLSHFIKKHQKNENISNNNELTTTKQEPENSNMKTVVLETKKSILSSLDIPNNTNTINNNNNINEEKKQNFEEKKQKNHQNFLEKRSNTKRDQRLKEYINYKEDLDFFVKYNNINESGVFLNEISKLENFNDPYISRNLQNLLKNDDTFLRVMPSLKSKIKCENLKREYEEKKRQKNILKTKKSNNFQKRYYEIKRNSENSNEDLKNVHDLSEDDTSLPSLTEATLDSLYRESLGIQRKIIKNKDSGFAARIRQFLKLEEISNSVEETNKQKLKKKGLLN